MKHSIVGLVLAFSLAVASPAVAQDSFNNDTMIFEFTEATITPVLLNRGITVTSRDVNSDGNVYLDVNFANGQTGRISFTAKLDGTEKRIGMAVAISFIPPAEWPDQRKIDLINEFNRQYWLTQVTMAENGEIYIMRYSVCDFGAPQGNINSELWSFESLAKKLQDELDKD